MYNEPLYAEKPAVLKAWKSTTIPPKHDVWVTEITLKSVTPSRLAKVQALLALLKERVIEL